jgi:DnaK suppressor protein
VSEPPDGGPSADVRALLAAARAESETRIVALRAEHARFVASTESSNADDEHDPEGATIAFEREQLGALLLAAQRGLADIDAAIGRLDAGTYGSCERCGRAIAAERLGARPAARTCIGCAST